MIYTEKKGWLITGIILFILSILLRFISLGILTSFSDSMFILSLLCIVFYYLTNIKDTNREMFISLSNDVEKIAHTQSEISDKIDNLNNKISNKLE